MSTATSTPTPPTRQSGPPIGSRPGGPAAAQSATSTIDPVKLLKQYYPMLILACMIGTGVGIVAHVVLAKFSPVYTAKVMFEVRDPYDPEPGRARVQQSRDEQERFLGTQMQLMTSNLILTPAVKSPKFLTADTWVKPFVELDGSGKPVVRVDNAVNELEKKISARVIPQTSFIVLSMNTKAPQDCAIIVNAVADAYIKDYRDRFRQGTKDTREALNTKIDALEHDIKDLDGQRKKVLEDNHIDSLDVLSTSEGMELGHINGDLSEVDRNMAAVSAQLDDYQKRLKSDSVEQIPEKLQEEAKKDPVIQSYEQKIATLKDSEAALRKQGYGDKHPDIQSIQANIETAQRNRDQYRDELLIKLRAAEIDGIRSAMVSITAQQKAMEEKRTKLNARREALQQAKVRFDQLTADINVAKENLARYQDALSKIDISGYRATEGSESVGDRVRIVQAGETPKALTFPKLKILAPAGALLFTTLVGGLIFLREALDQRVRGPQDAGMVPRVKVLGIVPTASDDPARPAAVETAFRDAPTGVVTESFRHIRAPLVQKMQQAGHRSLVVMGGMPGSGATTVATNLAIACAGLGEKVLLVDANFRRPAVHKVLKLQDGAGLADVLAGSASLEPSIQATTCENLSVLCAGTSLARAVPERLASEAMSRVLQELTSKYDRVFIDVPPAIVAGDGLAVANRSDAALVVVRAYHEKRGLLARIRNQLGDTRAEFLGVVVNAVRPSAGGYFKKNIKETHQYQMNGKA